MSDNPFVYDSEKQGTIEEYLLLRLRDDLEPIFETLENYHELWDKGFLRANRSVLRVTWDDFVDHCYAVIDRDKVKGIEAGAYSGEDGIHLLSDILAKGVTKYNANGLTVMYNAVKDSLEKIDFSWEDELIKNMK